ncbi:hypothetical protein JYU34_009373 [Plutella xylostella]|uniref:Uncharacterized protein n=1 Tax=Plutella xylostella TaxID=51655 RepID=A0ABQ7QJS3_PLUXY|nr:hypothetical protein JYU34_009373 [Plutella xylostella]
MKGALIVLLVAVLAVSAYGYDQAEFQDFSAPDMAPLSQVTQEPIARVARGACDPNTCDSNCRYCFNGKCDCNHH